jgi:uncharacterized protein (DUF1778 family)
MRTEPRSARLEARLPASVYAILKEAADLQGRSLSDFVVSSAREAAEEAIARSQEIKLSLAEQKRFAKAILNPPPLAAAMRKAAKAREQLLDRS